MSFDAAIEDLAAYSAQKQRKFKAVSGSFENFNAIYYKLKISCLSRCNEMTCNITSSSHASYLTQ